METMALVAIHACGRTPSDPIRKSDRARNQRIGIFLGYSRPSNFGIPTSYCTCTCYKDVGRGRPPKNRRQWQRTRGSA
eukprot:1195322-Prorocentrum_minimum.AAC.4